MMVLYFELSYYGFVVPRKAGGIKWECRSLEIGLLASVRRAALHDHKSSMGSGTHHKPCKYDKHRSSHERSLSSKYSHVIRNVSRKDPPASDRGKASP